MPPSNHPETLAHLSLGQATDYPGAYDASLLQAVPRTLNRIPLNIDEAALPFYGADEWTAYELSWLQPGGLPQVAVGRIVVPATSPNLIESKSFKLYLNSFNQTVFSGISDVQQTMVRDLSACAGLPVDVELFSLSEFTTHPLAELPGQCLDTLPVEITRYDYTPELLENCIATDGIVVEEILHSNLLKSNCLITNQPDWGSVMIHYKGAQISHQALLQYLVSFRNHNEFHEQCVERIFVDLMDYAKCQSLTVLARYTRRGGLDINPLRRTKDSTEGSTEKIVNFMSRTVRQ